MTREKFKASRIERILINLLTPFDAIRDGLKCGCGDIYHRHFKIILSEKTEDYERLVNVSRSNHEYKNILDKMKGYLCGRIAISTARVFRRLNKNY